MTTNDKLRTPDQTESPSIAPSGSVPRSTNHEEARRCAAAGLPVFPVGDDKRPLVKWRDPPAATTDLARVDGLWTRHCNALPAIDTGLADLLVIDLDRSVDPASPDGVEIFSTFAEANGIDLSRVPIVETPRGGLHLIFRMPEGEALGNSPGIFRGHGIDVRGRGGYIVAVGAVRADGKAYRAHPGSPDLRDPATLGAIPPLPKVLVDALKGRSPAVPSVPSGLSDHRPQTGVTSREKAYAAAALRGEAEMVANAPKGGRNEALNSAAFRLGRMAAAGWVAPDDIGDVLLKAAERSGLVKDDGLHAASATIASGMAAGRTSPAPPLTSKPRTFSEALGLPSSLTSLLSPSTDASVAAPLPSAVQAPAVLQAISPTPFNWRPSSEIPPRDWLYGWHLIRGFVSVTVSPGGIGKSSLVTAEALAMVSGRPLLGDQPTKPLNVWLWNGEDPPDELERRVAAAAMHHGINRDECQGRLFLDSGRKMPICIAMQDRSGILIAQPVVDALIKAIQDNAIDVLIVDPFVLSHGVAENDNNAVAAVGRCYSEIAEQTRCAIQLVHHTRKGNGTEGGADEARGASALVNAARSVRVLHRMTKDEADKAGIDPTNTGRYFRSDNAKANLAPVEEASWYELTPVFLGNATPTRKGDTVAVVTEWHFPKPFDNVTTTHLRQVQTKVRAGEWRFSDQTEEWVGRVIAEVLGLDVDLAVNRRRIKTILATWIKNGALVVVERKDKNSQMRKFVEVDKDDDIPSQPS